MVRRVATALLVLLALHTAMPLPAMEAFTHHPGGHGTGEPLGHSCPDGRSGDACPDGCACLCCPGHGTATPESPGRFPGILAPRPWPPPLAPSSVPSGRDDDRGVFRPPRPA